MCLHYYNLLPRLKELSKKSVSHGTKAKLEGANEEDEGDDDKDVVGQQLVEVGIAKDQALRVGRNPEYSGKYHCPNSHARGTKHQKDFPGKKRNVVAKVENKKYFEKINILPIIMVGSPSQHVCCKHLKTGSNDNGE